jgi:hypothetical protein
MAASDYPGCRGNAPHGRPRWFTPSIFLEPTEAPGEVGIIPMGMFPNFHPTVNLLISRSALLRRLRISLTIDKKIA